MIHHQRIKYFPKFLDFNYEFVYKIPTYLFMITRIKPVDLFTIVGADTSVSLLATRLGEFVFEACSRRTYLMASFDTGPVANKTELSAFNPSRRMGLRLSFRTIDGNYHHEARLAPRSLRFTRVRTSRSVRCARCRSRSQLIRLPPRTADWEASVRSIPSVLCTPCRP